METGGPKRGAEGALQGSFMSGGTRQATRAQHQGKERSKAKHDKAAQEKGGRRGGGGGRGRWVTGRRAGEDSRMANEGGRDVEWERQMDQEKERWTVGSGEPDTGLNRWTRGPEKKDQEGAFTGSYCSCNERHLHRRCLRGHAGPSAQHISRNHGDHGGRLIGVSCCTLVGHSEGPHVANKGEQVL